MEIVDNRAEECFAGKSQAELVALLESLLEREPVETLRRSVEAIKVAFYKSTLPQEEQQESVEQQEEQPTEPEQPTEQSEEQAPNEYEARLRELINLYRTRRDAYLAEQEQLRELNLRTKLQIIEELKDLTESDETLDHTFVKFRELQERWRATGQVPVTNVRDLWERYHLHTETFYAVIKINRELRDLDQKKNLEAKVALCEAAEALLSIEHPVEAFQQLQPLHDQWRETGPVAAEHKESIWLRFKEVTSTINTRHLDHFEALKAEQVENLARKEALCQRVEQIVISLPTSHKEWTAVSDQILEIQSEWKTIGFAPKRDNTEIYNRLRAACDIFFAAKREYYTEAKSEMGQNLERKRALCEAAEALAESEDWKTASASLIDLQTQWKSVGAVSRRHSDQVWKRFRAACDKFFERKSAHFAGKGSDESENLAAKAALIIEMTEAAAKGVHSIEEIKALQRRWSDIGFVPIKQKEALQRQYKEVVNKMFESLRGGERERNMGAFRHRISTMNSEGGNRAKGERERLAQRLKQLSADIIQLENNIGFFSRSKGAEAMIADVNRKIERARRDVEETKAKIKMIDQAARES